MSKRWLWITFMVMALMAAGFVGLWQAGASPGSAHMDYGPIASYSDIGSIESYGGWLIGHRCG